MQKRGKIEHKAQAALEFLMTYGWAILIVLAIIIGLYSFDFFRVDKILPDKCSLSPGIECLDYSVGASSVTLVLRNDIDEDMTIDKIAIVKGDSTLCSNTEQISLKTDEKATVSITNCDAGNVGEKLKGNIEITYKLKSPTSYSLKGSIRADITEAEKAIKDTQAGEAIEDVSGTVEDVLTQGQGMLVLFLTDKRVENLKELNVVLSQVEVHKDGEWIIFKPEESSFDLMLLDNVANVIGSKNLPAGKYTQIRMQVVSSNLKLKDGTTADVKIPSKEIKLVRQFTIESSKPTYLYIDFDPESVQEAGKQYILKPVIQLKTEKEFGDDVCKKLRCDDGNPCTSDSCSDGACFNEQLEEGTPCGGGKVCQSGACIRETTEKPAGECANINFGNFPHPYLELSGFYNGNVVLEDLNGNGDKDLIVSGLRVVDWEEYLKYNTSLQVKVFFNNGKGIFADSNQVLGKDSTYIDIGDIDNDGDKDLVTGSSYGYYNPYADIRSVRVYTNDGKGYFTDTQQMLGTISDYIPKLADLDNDGDLDLTTGNYYSTTKGKVFLNNGNGVFIEKTDSGLIEGQIRSIGLFDIDKDGDNDLIEASGYVHTAYNTNPNRIYKNDGTGKFFISQEINFNDSGQGPIYPGDYDKDGDLDYLNGAYLYKNDGKGTFTKATVDPVFDWVAFPIYLPRAVGDYDKDVDLDYSIFNIFTANDGKGNFIECFVPIYRSGGTSAFRSTAGDIDRDGDLDIVSVDYGIGLAIYVNNLIETPLPTFEEPSSDIVRITTDPGPQETPKIHGDKIVYGDRRNDYDIYMYDLTANKEIPIKTDLYDQILPDIYEDKIVWQQWNRPWGSSYGSWDVHLLDLSTGKETQITNDTVSQGAPKIDNNKIVWSDYRNGKFDVYMYDIDSGQESWIAEGSVASMQSNKILINNYTWYKSSTYPYSSYSVSRSFVYDLSTGQLTPTTKGAAFSIYGDKIVYKENNQLYVYDLSTGQETHIALTEYEYYRYKGRTAIYSDIVVWEEYRLGNWDIFMHDLSTGQETQLTKGVAAQIMPDIFENKIVWTDGGDIYMKIIS